MKIDEEEQNVDGIDVEGMTVSGTDVGEQTVPRDEETDQWFNLSYEELITQEADRPVVTASNTDEEMETVVFGTGVKEQQLQIFDENESSIDASDEYIVTEPEAKIVKDQGTDIPHVVPAAADKVSDDESMTLEEILLTIPADCPLPSALGEITKINLGESISIPGVNEGDWYKASLPKISVDAKGKAPLVIVDPVKGNPAKEQFSLICVDIEVLVQLREKFIDEVEQFFNSFSLKKLAVLMIEDFYAKEEKVLTWAETDSTREALQRRMYILTKYRELLTRKFVEAYKSNFVPGEGSSATYLKVLDMLSNLHLFLLEELKILMQAHGLTWDRTCCSQMFEGRQRDHGALISRSNPNIGSSCWIRTMILVNGTWRPHSPSTSADSSMHFVEDDTNFGDDAGSNQLSPPVVSADFSVSFDDLRASISQLIARQKKDTRRLDDSQNDILSELNKLEKYILAALLQHEEVNRSMIQNVCQESRTQSDALSVKLNDFRKGVQGHSAFVTSDLADVRKEQKAQRAMIESLVEQVAAIRNDLLDFCAKAKENHLNLSTQLGFLVDYINRGGDAKKGEGGSSRPQPPPDEQERPSGGSTGRGSSGGDGSQRRSD
ncbi:hypothetical protein F511_02148 [Dorcoceras hygrometricum]|uniref:Uncharacterized protein n=1 Tax=Dorcoceras hygrometricum TaxID=472368 RepID=A0A2Z7D9W0_9LAMI|nr:hypothetical protein F511_02148 [Dorcoceras hygrometricum]